MERTGLNLAEKAFTGRRSTAVGCSRRIGRPTFVRQFPNIRPFWEAQVEIFA